MNIENISTLLKSKDGLHRTLGIEFLSTPEPDTCAARMTATPGNCQPFGFLNGGATLALAENIAGAGSMTLCPDKMCMGISVTGHHLKAVPQGQTVTATARILHQGNTLHLWHVEIKNDDGDIISSIDVENYIVK